MTDESPLDSLETRSHSAGDSSGKRMREREREKYFSDESPAKNIFECENFLRGLVGGLFLPDRKHFLNMGTRVMTDESPQKIH
jgi:hypothetical protein